MAQVVEDLTTDPYGQTSNPLCILAFHVLPKNHSKYGKRKKNSVQMQSVFLSFRERLINEAL